MTLESVSKAIGELLIKKNLTLSTAESCTGGLIAAAITDCPGSSQYFKGSVVAYCNSIKEHVLNVPSEILARHGAVSSETVIAMVHGANALLKTNCSISVSGIAGPGGGTLEKPVGLVYTGIAINGYVTSIKNNFVGNRTEIREKTAFTALCQFLKALEDFKN
ncbi:MAG: CinA family protein [Fibrobacter sp.]|nr:CinA family protein [Fibrobacter sp.]